MKEKTLIKDYTRGNIPKQLLTFATPLFLSSLLQVVYNMVDMIIVGNVMGEVGLAGEVRTVPQCERRITECARLGFTTIIVPRANAGRVRAPEGVKVVGVDTVAQALSVIF